METDPILRALLFDTYGSVLSEKQQLCFDLHYNQDLSLGEIGELEGISRQAVRDNILRAEKTLLDLEEKIGAVAQQRRADAAADEIFSLLSRLQALGPGAQTISEALEKTAQRLKE